MTTILSTGILSSTVANIARAISAFADEARADNALILSTAIVGSDSRITDSGEGYTGVIRFLKYTDPTGTTKPTENAVSTELTTNQLLTIGNDVATYIKNIDVVGAQEASIQSLISKTDGLSYLGSKFGAVRARREDTSLRSVIAGIGSQVLGTYTEPAANAVAHTQNSFGYVTGFTKTGSVWAPLFAQTSATASAPARSNFFDTLLDSLSAVTGEFEEPFYYLVVSPSTFNVLRKENVLDGSLVQDGNLNVNTLLGGKIRLIVTGSTIGGIGSTLVTAGLAVSYLMKSGAVHYSNVAVNNPTAIDTNPLANNGGGAVTVVSRWGNVIHPMGYSFTGTTTTYPSNAVLGSSASWTTVASNVNQTGIFPIFHG